MLTSFKQWLLFQPLKRKILWVIMVIVVITVATISSFLYWQKYEQQRQDFIRNNLALVKLVAEYTVLPLVFDDKKGAEEQLSKLWQDPRIVYVRLENTNGQILIDYDPSNYAATTPLPEIKQEWLWQNSRLYFAVTVSHKLEKLGTLKGAFRLDEFKQDQRQEQYFMFSVILIAVLCSYVMALMLRRFVMASIEQLERHARRIAKDPGAYETIVYSEHRKDEISHLYQAFNLLMERIQKREDEILKFNRDLEVKIQERTKDLQAAVQIKSSFLANMSHEIRTPMNAIIGMTHLMLQTDLTPKQRNYQDKINTSAKWLLGILNDILDFSKLEAGKLKLEYTEFMLEPVMEYLADIMSPLINSKQLALSFEVEPDVPTALIGDSLRLGQVLLNLLGNAIKFTDAGKVTVRVQLLGTEAKQAHLRFSVIDTGIGLNEEQQSQLFSAFNQADNSTTRKYGGTGLGLSISKQLVEAMGGAIGIESCLGVGSTFYFTVTLGLQDESKLKSLPPPTITPDKYPVLNNVYLLLVEDNLINQEVMLEVLSHEGIRVDVAINGKEAVSMISRNDYSVVLMDCQMPVMDGFEASRLIRADSRFADLPIIALTANAMPEDRELCLASGMNDHIVKPINWDTFFQTLARWVRPIDDQSIQYAPIPTHKEAWFDLPGFELKGIMSALHGNQEKLGRLLGAFREQLVIEAPIIATQIEYRNLVDAHKQLHALTGIAGNLGAKEFHQACTVLNAQLQSGKFNDTTLADWIRISDKTISTLSATLTHSSPEVPPGDVPTLQQLMGLLAHDSFISDQLLTQFKLLFPDDKQAEYTALTQYILDTDYPKAQQVLNTVIDFSNEKIETSDQHPHPIILIVDDTRVNQEILDSLLKQYYQIKVAGNGVRALDIAKHSPHPDLILLDVNMPQMDGYEICQKLQENILTRHIPIIFVTAEFDKESESHGLQLGAVDYITKPINPAIVLQRVRNQILLKQHEKELQRIAHYDALTGIPNRILLADRMAQAIAQSKREGGMLGVCYLDLDGFKPVNDTLGHQAGDQVLIEIARRIESILRKGDTCARLGGDEFVVLLPNLHHAEKCIVTVKRLLEIIARPILVQDQPFFLTASIGITICPGDDSDADGLLSHADQAMYVAKQSGKNRYHLFNSVQNQ
ncbi:response regulator [Methylobacter sp.]|uniref:response regulator n=1 Tax=Methylobacter sp. TaxID=2051955 RepID=UPI001228C1FC|nr:response regulator [Methylobacter sp.]TAK62602.1 MAG: response regulator [Methylobacter sp.]